MGPVDLKEVEQLDHTVAEALWLQLRPSVATPADPPAGMRFPE